MGRVFKQGVDTEPVEGQSHPEWLYTYDSQPSLNFVGNHIDTSWDILDAVPVAMKSGLDCPWKGDLKSRKGVESDWNTIEEQ